MLFKIISSETLSKYLRKNRILLIDLRSRENYRHSHIPGAVWMDWEHADTSIDALSDNFHASHGFYPDWIVLYCEAGNISLLTARDLARMGYPIMSLNGGFHRWNGPLESNLRRTVPMPEKGIDETDSRQGNGT